MEEKNMAVILPEPDQLFTSVNIVSVGIATLAVNVVTNALYKLANLNQKWTAFITALVIAYLIVAISGNQHWYDWILAFFNACLLFCSALGLNETGVATFTPPGTGFAKPVGFFNSWMKQ
jgi:hypothetical protein